MQQSRSQVTERDGLYELAAAVEHLAAGRGVEVVADGLDQAVGAEQVGAVAFLMGDQGGATDQQRHSEFLSG